MYVLLFCDQELAVGGVMALYTEFAKGCSQLSQVKSSQSLFIQHYLYRQADQCALQSNRISHDRQNKKN